MTAPFVYLIGWRDLGVYYYGVRFQPGCQPADLWTTYFTSSSSVKRFRKEHGEPDIRQVRRTFSWAADAYRWEQKGLRRLGAARSPKFLNLPQRMLASSAGKASSLLWIHPDHCGRPVIFNGEAYVQLTPEEYLATNLRRGVWYLVDGAYPYRSSET